ncbi:MAG: ABC transporter permease [Candidatus Acetothermia bacterium]|jgi:simple sugar transport system permease protein|nr:ABC transporter permease [Candidatus Acetothermia bacterium]
MPSWLNARLSWSVLRLLVMVGVIVGVFSLFLLLQGKDPVRAYQDIVRINLQNPRGLAEVLVRMSPLLLTALGVAIPFRAGLINVGAEGQFMVGALVGTWAALNLGGLPRPVLLPVVILAGMAGGAAWGLVPGVLRARGWMNETITTLLLNYVAPLIVGYFVFGPWRAAEFAIYPQTAEIPPAARFPILVGGTRLHLGFALGLAALLLYGYGVARTRWGLELKTVGGNPEAARRLGLSVGGWMVAAMALGGALAGLAGIAEVAAIHSRLKLAISPGYGFMGFLVNWLAFANPVGILLMAFLMALIAASGFTLQITQQLPFAAVNVLMALILFTVLAKPLGKGVRR